MHALLFYVSLLVFLTLNLFYGTYFVNNTSTKIGKSFSIIQIILSIIFGTIIAFNLAPNSVHKIFPYGIIEY
jgi:hypothetical protein